MGVLKSDHFGIEMSKTARSVRGYLSLKSDHFGIEIVFFFLEYSCCVCTKIRPFWD